MTSTALPLPRSALRPDETLETFVREAIARQGWGISQTIHAALTGLDATPAERSTVEDGTDLGNLVYHKIDQAYVDRFDTVPGLGVSMKINRAIRELYHARVVARVESDQPYLVPCENCGAPKYACECGA